MMNLRRMLKPYGGSYPTMSSLEQAFKGFRLEHLGEFAVEQDVPWLFEYAVEQNWVQEQPDGTFILDLSPSSQPTSDEIAEAELSVLNDLKVYIERARARIASHRATERYQREVAEDWAEVQNGR